MTDMLLKMMQENQKRHSEPTKDSGALTAVVSLLGPVQGREFAQPQHDSNVPSFGEKKTNSQSVDNSQKKKIRVLNIQHGTEGSSSFSLAHHGNINFDMQIPSAICTEQLQREY